MPKVVVFFDAVCWTERNEFTKALDHFSAKKGDEVDIPDEHIARFASHQAKDGLPRVGSRDEYEAWVSGVDTTGAQPAMSDQALQALSPEQVIAHMNSNNSDATRVLALEESRPKPRKAIIDHAHSIVDAAEQLNTPY